LGGGFQNENGDRFVCETGVYFYEMDHRGFGMILRQNRRFLQKNDSFVLRDALAPVLARSSLIVVRRQKNNGPGQRPSPQPKEVKL
jgi:hypothetical protein